MGHLEKFCVGMVACIVLYDINGELVYGAKYAK